jgi:hypothetical protein
MHPSKTCFISAGLGAWYNLGAERFKGSLHGHNADVQIWKDEWPPGGFPRECPYTVKAAAFDYAIKQGYRTIIWGDASVTARKSTDAFIAAVNAKGYWLGSSGYNAAQTASDAQLAYFGMDRDWAQQVPDTATGLFGVCLDHAIARDFMEMFIKAGRDQAFHGSRKHAKQSADPRFLFCRQDQSCASVITGKLGMKLDAFSEHCRFRWDRDRLDTIFHCEGM